MGQGGWWVHQAVEHFSNFRRWLGLLFFDMTIPHPVVFTKTQRNDWCLLCLLIYYTDTSGKLQSQPEHKWFVQKSMQSISSSELICLQIWKPLRHLRKKMVSSSMMFWCFQDGIHWIHSNEIISDGLFGVRILILRLRKLRWNLQITRLKRKIIWTKPPWDSILVFRGVFHFSGFILMIVKI